MIVQAGCSAFYVMAFGPPFLVKVIANAHFMCEIEIPAGRNRYGEEYPLSRKWVDYAYIRPVSALEELAKAADEEISFRTD